MDIYFQDLDIVAVVLGGVVFLFFAIQLYYYSHYFSGVIRKNRKDKQGRTIFNFAQPPVSVIICARNESENLSNFLPKVLEQRYPNFEVILVNDGSEDNTDIVLSALQQKYTNLYVTNIPTGTNIISRKKLAITIGIKAAKNELLLFTDADCYPVSEDWISLMVQNMTADTEFVIGFGDYMKEKSFINRLISYDTLFIAMQYFGFAYAGKPYMGVGRNLMYKRSTFYRNKGFAGHLHIASGDDDLLINKAGNRTNTAIACKANSKTMSVPEKTFAKWCLQKKRHLRASALYSTDSRRRIGMEAVSRYLFYLSLIPAALTFNIYLIAFAALLVIIRYIKQLSTINKTAKILNTSKHVLAIPIFDILLPIISFCLLITNGKNNDKSQPRSV